MKIKYVKQKHPNGCAIACLAMVTGIAYDKIEQQFRTDFNYEGLLPEVTREFACEHGFGAVESIAWGYSDVRQSNKRMARPFANVHIVTVKPTPDAQIYHAVVMDRRGRVFDPSKPHIKDLSSYYEIVRVIGLFDERLK